MSKPTYLIKDTDKYQTYRIYKRIFKNPSTKKMSGYAIVNLTVAKNKKWFKFSLFKKDRTTINLTFHVKDGTIISNSGNKNLTIHHINMIREIFPISKNGYKRSYTKYTQAKVNRVLRNIFPNLRNKDNTQDFLKRYIFDSPLYDFFRSDDMLALRKELRKSQNLKEFLKRTIKYSGKKTLKIVAEHPDKLKLVHSIKLLKEVKKYTSHGLVNDFLISDVKTYRSEYLLQTNAISEYKKLLKIKPEMIKEILLGKNKYWIIEDIPSLVKRLRKLNYEITKDDLKGSSEKIHDHLSDKLRKIKTKNVECPEYFKPIQVDDLLIRTPKDTHEIIDWGKEMKHCIGGYVDSHLAQKNIVGAVYKDGELKWNFSMRPVGSKYRLGQLLGKLNTRPPKEILEKFVDIMKKEDILVEDQSLSQVWGF